MKAADANPLADRARFSVWTPDRIRLIDLDFQHHVNNVAFASFCATGRYNFLQTYFRPLVGFENIFSVVKLTIDYLGELRYPGDVETGTLVRRFGRSSFVFGQGLFSEGVCVATSEAVMVYVDGRTRKALPVPAEVIAAMAPFTESPPAIA
ncbi:MAG: acyl-CoA thioesterase [Burkholderiales bacterium]